MQKSMSVFGVGNKKRNRSKNSSPNLLDSSLEQQLQNLPKKQNTNKSAETSINLEFSSSWLNDSHQFNYHLHNKKDIIQPNSTEMDVEMSDPEIVQLPSEIDQFLVEFGSRNNYDDVSNGDLMRGLIAVVKNLKSVESKIASLEEKVESVSAASKKNTGDIQICRDDIAINRKLALQSIAGTNYVKQYEIDRQVFITGIGINPTEKVVVADICKFYKIPQNSISSHKIIPIKDKHGTPKGSFMNMEFATKEDHIEFLKKVYAKGDAPTDPSGASTSSPVKDYRISRRLTYENRQVSNELQRLKANGHIADIRYRHCCYEFKLPNADNYIPAPSIEELKYGK